jgi:acyl-CoA thioester hydrolase
MTESNKPAALAEYPVVVVIPIQWGDQDAFGHVNNTVPIRWFESARVAYMEQGGLGHMMSSDGLGPILAAISCQYRKQLNYPDTVHVGARVTKLGKSSMTIGHAVYSEALGAIAVEGESVIVVFDYPANRPRRVPDDMRAQIEKLEGKSFAE